MKRVVGLLLALLHAFLVSADDPLDIFLRTEHIDVDWLVSLDEAELRALLRRAQQDNTIDFELENVSFAPASGSDVPEMQNEVNEPVVRKLSQIADTCAAYVNYPVDSDAVTAAWESANERLSAIEELVSSEYVLSASLSPQCWDSMASFICATSVPKTSAVSVSGYSANSDAINACSTSFCQRLVSDCTEPSDISGGFFNALTGDMRAEVFGYLGVPDTPDEYCATFADDEVCFHSTNKDEHVIGGAVLSLNVPITGSADSSLSSARAAVAAMLDLAEAAIIMDANWIADGLMTITIFSHENTLTSTPHFDFSSFSALDISDATSDAVIAALVDAGYSCDPCVSPDATITTANVDAVSLSSGLVAEEEAAIRDFSRMCLGIGSEPTCSSEECLNRLDRWFWETADVCSYQGILCECVYASEEATSCDVRVVELDLTNAGLACDFPTNMTSLSALRVLRLGYNDFDTMPDTRALPTSLVEFSMYESDLQGDIAPWLEELTNLEVLNLGRRPIKPSFLTRVVYVSSHSSNNMAGSLDFIGSLSNLRVLNLAYNDFKGDYDVNPYVPRDVCALELLEEMHLDSNNLFNRFSVEDSGAVDDLTCITAMPALKEFWGNDNNFYGEIPLLLDLAGPLEAFGVRDNQLGGPFECPDDDLALREFVVGGNPIATTIPSCIAELTTLRLLEMGSAELTGTIPDLDDLSNLVYLSIGDNPLLDATEMRALEIPFSLSYLDLSNAHLTGTFPRYIRRMEGLTSLYVGSNELEGTLPDNLPTGLTELDISSNMLGGRVPNEWNSLTALTVLRASDNLITGLAEYNVTATMWPPMCSMALLTELDLSVNLIADELPDCFGYLPLRYLDLSENQFTGILPETLGYITPLEELNLEHNRLAGGIPFTYLFLSNLNRLYLSYNELEDTISNVLSPLKHLPSLVELRLSHNNIYDSFSYTDFGAGTDYFFAKLSELYVSDNLLSGTATFVIGQLYSIRRFDGSNNYELEGEVPSSYSSLDVLILTGTNVRSNAAYDDNNLLPSFAELENNFVETSVAGRDDPYVIMCPKLTAQQKDMVLELDPEYYKFKYCRCAPGYWGTPGEFGVDCEECLVGATCPGGNITTTDLEVVEAPLVVLEGYYPTPPQYAYLDETIPGYAELINADVDDPEVRQRIWAASPNDCSWDQRDGDSSNSSYACVEVIPHRPQALQECFMASRTDHTCEGGSVDQFMCLEGHTGRLCSACIPGYYPSGRKCTECPPDAGVYVVFVILVTLACVFVFFLMRKTPLLITLLVAMKSLLFFLQTMNIIFSKTTLRWPATLLTFDQYYSYANFSVTIFSCVFGSDNMAYGPRYVLVVLIECWIMLVAIGGFLSGGLTIWVTEKKNPMDPANWPAYKEWGLKCVHFFMYCMNFFYLPVTVRMFGVLNCEEDLAEVNRDGDPVSYMAFAPYQKCEGSDYDQWRSMAIAMIPLFLLGVPAFFAAILLKYGYRANRLDDIMTPFSFLFKPYKDNMYLYEMVVFARRLIIAVAVTSFQPGEASTFFLLFLLLAASLAGHMYWMPFRDDVVNDLEVLALATVNICFAVGLIFSSAEVHEGVRVIEVLLVITNVFILVFFFFLALDILFGLRGKIKDKTGVNLTLPSLKRFLISLAPSKEEVEKQRRLRPTQEEQHQAIISTLGIKRVPTFGFEHPIPYYVKGDGAESSAVERDDSVKLRAHTTGSFARTQAKEGRARDGVAVAKEADALRTMSAGRRVLVDAASSPSTTVKYEIQV